MNSRQKGKRGERQWRDELRAHGYAARRGQQFSGSPESPDVICEGLSWMHFEVKAVERLNIEEAMNQARKDAGKKEPVVAHKRNFSRWLVTMEAETFFKFLSGALPPGPSGLPQEKILGVSREAHDTTGASPVLPENAENKNSEQKQNS